MIGIDKKWIKDCREVHTEWEGTHLFLGSHCMPQCRQYYLLPCNVLKQGRSKKVRIKLFGLRFYHTHPVGKIVYVERHKINTVAERLVD